MRTTLSSKGQIVLPAELRQRDNLSSGQQFSIERIDAGVYLLKDGSSDGRGGLVDWLAACPEKDWFRPLSDQVV